MEIAESLYQRGYISYPRTETDSFKEGTDLQSLIHLQTSDGRWGNYAQTLLNSKFVYPRNGGHDDGAHPPIHPTKTSDGLSSQDDIKVHEFITRHFLASCSADGQRGPNTKARNYSASIDRFTLTRFVFFFFSLLLLAIGQQTSVIAVIASERFHSKGLMITERSFLEVYPYDRWAEHAMPTFQQNQRVIPYELNMRESKTEPPPLLSVREQFH